MTAEPSGGVRVLVVEDDPGVQQIAVEMLCRLGCETDVASNGRQALQTIAGKRYDLILMDCQIPELSGVEVTRRIRALEESIADRVAIVGITGLAGPAERDECAAAGMDDCLSKPFGMSQLKGILERWAPSLPDAVREGASSSRPPGGEMTVMAIDRDVVERIRVLDASGDLLRGLVTAHLDGYSRHLPELRMAVARGDAEAVSQTAHRLKSSSANLGALKLASVCGELEGMGRASQLERAGAVVEELEAEHTRVRAARLEELGEGL